MHIPPPIPARDIPLNVEKNLQEAANEIASIAVPLIRDVLGELGSRYGDLHEELENWLYQQGGIRHIAAELDRTFLGSGADRLVFDMGAFVAKFELVGSESNAAEWEGWFARPYVLSEDGTVEIMEKLVTHDDTIKILVSQILEQEPWMIDFVDDPAWYNWGYRIGSETPVVLDYGL